MHRILRKPDRRWLLVALILLAFALRVGGLTTQSLWRDEVDSVRFASRPIDDLLQTFSAHGQNGPLYFLLLAPWLDLAGTSEFALRYWSLACGVLSTPLLYRLARRLFPGLPAVALLSVALAAVSPYLVWYSQEGKMYSFVVVLAILSMERLLAALDEGGWHRWLTYVLTATAAVYTHFVAALLIPVQALVFLLYARQLAPARRRAGLFSLGALAVPYLPLLTWQLPLLQSAGETGYPFVPLPEMAMSLLSNYALGVVQQAAPWMLAFLLVLLAAAGFLIVDSPSRLRSLTVLVTWMLLPIALFFLITLVRPMYTARYLILAAPALLVTLAAGVVALWSRSRTVAGVLLAAVLVFSVRGLVLQIQTPVKADFRAATRYVADRMESEDLVLFHMPYGRHSFEYYFRGIQSPSFGEAAPGAYRLYLPFVRADGRPPYRWAEGLYTNAGISSSEANHQLEGMLADSEVVWLVASEAPMWDERGLVKAWLDEHASLTAEAEFTRVAVLRYQLPANR